LFVAGLNDRAEALHARIEAVAARFSRDPAVTACIFHERYGREQCVGNVGGCRALAEAAIQHFEQAGDLRAACHARINLGFTECLLGAYAEAVLLLRAALADAERMGLEALVAGARHNLGLALGGLGALEEARAAELLAIAAFAVQKDRKLEGGSRKYLAWISRRGSTSPAGGRPSSRTYRRTPARSRSRGRGWASPPRRCRSPPSGTAPEGSGTAFLPSLRALPEMR
jgi:tetratricopeptide (TPR) repeat protein